MSSIRPSDVQAIVSGLPLAPSTVATVVQHLRSVMRSAVRDGILVRDPDGRREVAAGGQWRGGATHRRRGGSIYKVAAPEFRAAVVLGAAIGLRQAEASALTAERIDWLRRTVRIDRQWSQVNGWAPPQTRASTRTIPVA